MTGSDKITDPDLAAFAATHDDARRSVIVEAELPGAYVPKRPPAKKLVKPRSAKRPTQDKYALAADRSMAKLETYLSELGLLADALRLSAASSFVLDATPDELRALCESPLVAAIRPNRVHKVVGRG